MANCENCHPDSTHCHPEPVEGRPITKKSWFDKLTMTLVIAYLLFALLLFIELQLFFVAFLYLERKQTEYIKQLIFMGE